MPKQKFQIKDTISHHEQMDMMFDLSNKVAMVAKETKLKQHCEK